MDFGVPAVEERYLRFILKEVLVKVAPFPVSLLVPLLGNNPAGITTISLSSYLRFILVFLQLPALTLRTKENIVPMMVLFKTVYPYEILHPVIGTTHLLPVDIDRTGIRIDILLVILIIILVIIIVVIVYRIGGGVQTVIPTPASPVVGFLGVVVVVFECVMYLKSSAAAIMQRMNAAPMRRAPSGFDLASET